MPSFSYTKCIIRWHKYSFRQCLSVWRDRCRHWARWSCLCYSTHSGSRHFRVSMSVLGELTSHTVHRLDVITQETEGQVKCISDGLSGNTRVSAAALLWSCLILAPSRDRGPDATFFQSEKKCCKEAGCSSIYNKKYYNWSTLKVEIL